jgi:hypothetical protein
MTTGHQAYPSLREPATLPGGDIEQSEKIGTVDERVRHLQSRLSTSAHLIKVTLDAVLGLQEQMREMRSQKAEFSGKLDNTLAVQRNRHSRGLDSHLHRISKIQPDGSWICHPAFPETVRRLRRMNGEN